MICVVTKQFSSTVPHKVGDLVDTDGWPHERKLIDQRYLRAATPAEAAKYKAPETATSAPKPAAQPARVKGKTPRQTVAAGRRSAAARA